MRRAFLVSLILLLPGCCFIGCEEEVLILPAAEIRVTDPAGEPIEGATVTVSRHVEHPHFQRPSGLYSETTAASGVARFEHQMGTEKQYPLMMHGVAYFAWQLCAEAPGRQTRAMKWFSDGVGLDDAPWESILQGREPLELSIPLPEGDDISCEEALDDELRELRPGTAEWEQLCESDDDCAYLMVNPNCCPLCFPTPATRAEVERREKSCEGVQPTECQECPNAPIVDPGQSECRAGWCRRPRTSTSGD